MVSQAHYDRSRNVNGEADKTFRRVLREKIVEGHPAYGAWSHNVLAWYHRPAQAKTVWIKFEDLVNDAAHWVGEALRQLGVDRPRVTEEPLPSFSQLHGLKPKMFRKGKSGGWREEMADTLQGFFWERHAAAMDLFGYSDGRPEWLSSTPRREAA
jgi:hypothetical protein